MDRQQVKTDHQHGDGLSKDGAEQIERSGGRDEEEITGKQIFPTTVVKHRILKTPKQTLKRILHISTNYNNIHK